MRVFIKRLLLFISSIVFHNRGSKILFYHDVYCDNQYTDMGTSLAMFTEHIKTIKKNKFSIVDNIIDKKNEIKICFDDGFKGIYDTRKFFIESGIHPTVFLATTLIGQPGYLNHDEILELQELGFIFQCHAWSHSDLSEFSKEELHRELYDSKILLEDILGKNVDEICFPIGYFSQLVLDECQRYGYKTMYSSIPGNYFDKIFTNGLKTRNLVQFASPSEVKSVLLGGYHLLHNRYVKMHWRG